MTTRWLWLVPLFSLVSSQCYFTKTQAQNETRIIATKTGNKYELFYEDVVPANANLYLICDAADVVSVKCQRNGQFSKNLPTADCKKPPKAAVEVVTDSSCPATMYSVGYKFGNDFMELFRNCYDASKMRALFAVHDYHSYALVTDRPEATFTGDGIVNTADAASFTAKKIYERFNELLGSGQPYVTSMRDIVFNRGHLTPVADYLHTYNMRATFKYINVIPKFSKINQGNWKIIEDYSRNAALSSGKVRVLTGALGTLSLTDRNNNWVPIFLLTRDRNPVPEWIYKIIISPSRTITFVTYNNVYAPVAPQPNCNPVGCPPEARLKNSKESGFTFCCDSRDFIRRNVPLLEVYL